MVGESLYSTYGQLQCSLKEKEQRKLKKPITTIILA